MTSDVDPFFSPRTIVRARTHQAAAFRRQFGIALRTALRGLRALKTRVARAWHHHRELELLMHADDRMLADIEATEGDAGARAFACHKDRALAADQRRRGVPNLRLRLLLMSTPALVDQLSQATGTADCYRSVTALVRLNLAADRMLHLERYAKRRRA